MTPDEALDTGNLVTRCVSKPYCEILSIKNWKSFLNLHFVTKRISTKTPFFSYKFHHQAKNQVILHFFNSIFLIYCKCFDVGWISPCKSCPNYRGYSGEETLLTLRSSTCNNFKGGAFQIRSLWISFLPHFQCYFILFSTDLWVLSCWFGVDIKSYLVALTKSNYLHTCSILVTFWILWFPFVNR